MERKIYKDITNKEFYDILANTDELNKTILSNLYASIVGFITLSQNSTSNSNLVDLLKEYEAKAYVTKNRVLTDKEIIDYELTRIAKEYKKQIGKDTSFIITTLSGITDEEIHRHLLILVEYYLEQLKIFKEIPESSLTQEDIFFIKKRIAYIETLLKMKNGLYYEIYLNFCEELERIMKIYKEDITYKKENYNNENIYYKKR